MMSPKSDTEEQDEFSHFSSTNNDLEFSEEEDTVAEEGEEPVKVEAAGAGSDLEGKAVVAQATDRAEGCDFKSRKPIIPMTCVPMKCRRNFTGALLLILSFLLFADQQLIAPNLHEIGDDFNLTDDGEGWNNIDLVLGGYLPLFFFALGTPISLFIGPLIDRSHRRNLFVALIFLAEIPCFLTYFASEIWQLLFFRALTGISMAGAEPLIYSIMSDMYSTKERTVMASVISIGAGAGLLAGQALAGFMGPSIGWRYPFLVVSLPSMAFASLVMFIVEEPERGAKEDAVDNVKEDGGQATYGGNLSCAKLCAIVKVGTNLCLYLGELPNAMGWGVLFAYLADYIAVDKNFGTAGATTAVSIFGVGLGLGAFSGGILGQVLTNRCKHVSGAVPIAVALSVTLGALPFYWAIDSAYDCDVDFAGCNETLNYTEGYAWDRYIDDCIAEGYLTCSAGTWATMVIVMLSSGLLLGVPNANVRAMLINVNLPEVRGSTMTLLVVVSNLGKGVGPLLAAAMIGQIGRFDAFNIAVGFFIISAVPYFACICQLGKDIRRQAMAVEAIVQVKDRGKSKKKKVHKKVTITATNEILVEQVDDVEIEMGKTKGMDKKRRGATVPVGGQRKKTVRMRNKKVADKYEADSDSKAPTEDVDGSRQNDGIGGTSANDAVVENDATEI